VSCQPSPTPTPVLAVISEFVIVAVSQLLATPTSELAEITQSTTVSGRLMALMMPPPELRLSVHHERMVVPSLKTPPPDAAALSVILHCVPRESCELGWITAR